MTSSTLQKEIEATVPRLLEMARELTWNKISDNCKFILSEIKNSDGNFQTERKLRIKENDLKVPVTLEELMPALQNLYNNVYDLNLYVYRSGKDLTIIDIRCYLKSSLDADYRAMVIDNEPMLHCKIPMPASPGSKNVKFDINWEYIS
jgi:hypothetical protein